jgi:hypothetical protein
LVRWAHTPSWSVESPSNLTERVMDGWMDGWMRDLARDWIIWHGRRTKHRYIFDASGGGGAWASATVGSCGEGMSGVVGAGGGELCDGLLLAPTVGTRPHAPTWASHFGLLAGQDNFTSYNLDGAPPQQSRPSSVADVVAARLTAICGTFGNSDGKQAGMALCNFCCWHSSLSSPIVPSTTSITCTNHVP